MSDPKKYLDDFSTQTNNSPDKMNEQASDNGVNKDKYFILNEVGN